MMSTTAAARISAPAALPQPPRTGLRPRRVAAAGLNLRGAPSPVGSVLATLEHRELVLMNEPLIAGAWAGVVVPEQPPTGHRGGFVNSRFLETVPHGQDNDPLWLLALAAREGETEIAGRAANQWTVRAHALTSLHAMDDETAWCSSAMNWAFSVAGQRGTGSAAALSWMDWGSPLANPVRGCVVVLTRADRKNPKAAHVAAVLAARGRRLTILGGNQSNRVGVQELGSWRRVLGFRWPRGVPVPQG